MTPLATAVLWLVLSILAAPLVGRAIRLGHDRDACRTCQAVRAAREAQGQRVTAADNSTPRSTN